MKHLIIILSLGLFTQFSFAAETTSTDGIGGLETVDFELDMAIEKAKKLETPADIQSFQRNAVSFLARAKLMWYRTALAYSESECDLMENSTTEKCNLLEKTMDNIKQASGEVMALVSALPVMGGIALGLGASNIIRRLITESGGLKTAHWIANGLLGVYTSYLSVTAVKKMRNLPADVKEKMVKELELSVRALDVGAINSLDGFRDLIGHDNEIARNFNVPFTDRNNDNRLEQWIKSYSLTEKKIQNINEMYEQQFGGNSSVE